MQKIIVSFLFLLSFGSMNIFAMKDRFNYHNRSKAGKRTPKPIVRENKDSQLVCSEIALMSFCCLLGYTCGYFLSDDATQTNIPEDMPTLVSAPLLLSMIGAIIGESVYLVCCKKKKKKY